MTCTITSPNERDSFAGRYPYLSAGKSSAISRTRLLTEAKLPLIAWAGVGGCRCCCAAADAAAKRRMTDADFEFRFMVPTLVWRLVRPAFAGAVSGRITPLARPNSSALTTQNLLSGDYSFRTGAISVWSFPGPDACAGRDSGLSPAAGLRAASLARSSLVKIGPSLGI